MPKKVETVGAHVILHRIVDTFSDKEKHKYEKATLLYKRTQDAPDHPEHWALIGGELKGTKEKKNPQKTNRSGYLPDLLLVY